MAGYEQARQQPTGDGMSGEETGEAAEPAGAREDVITRTRGLAEALTGMVGDTARLLAVDARLCASTALAMLALALIASLLVVATWLLANAGAALFLVRLEIFTPATAFLAVAGVNLLVAVLLGLRLRSIARDLTFQQSRAAIGSILSTRNDAGPVSRSGEESCSPAAD